MPGSFNSDQDEFDSLLDDQQLLDPELEESLAQAEAIYTASQAVPQAGPSSSTFAAAQQPQSSFRLSTDSSRQTNRRGTFVPPVAKRPRIDPGPSRLSHVKATAPSSRFQEAEADQVIVRNHRDEDFAGNDDEQWWAGNNTLDQVEQEAIRMSQQLPASQPYVSISDTNNAIKQLAQEQLGDTASRTSIANPRKPPDPDSATNKNATHPNHADANADELDQLRAEVERLRAAQKAQEELVDKLKQEAYCKSGEVSVVRQNLTKLNKENSKLREREVLRELEHKAALDRLKRDQERQLQRLETETAFRRVEQDTSRRIWPSSVARLQPVGLNTVDRKQQSQVRAGLTTPTKANRYGSRGSGSSGRRQRYANNTADRDEPGTPSKSATKPMPHFPRPPTMGTSAGKGKAFRTLQNSFADFGPVQEKIRQQKRSPAKVTKAAALAPAEWGNDQSMVPAHADQDDIAMPDVHPEPPPKTAETEHHQQGSEPRARQREYHYLAAVSEILHRRTIIVSLLLSHASSKAAAPASYPTNRFNTSGSHPTKSNIDTEAVPNTNTLSRLISASLVADCPKLLVFRYRKAVESLLASLSTARVMEPEEREDALRLLSADGTDQSPEELDFSFATMHLSHAIASSLMVMAGVLLRTCQTDLLADVLRLVSCLVSMLPRFWMDLECFQPNPDAKRDELTFVGADDSQATAEWLDLATPINLREILAHCINDCKPRSIDGEELAAGLKFGDWQLSSDAREDLLQAVVQVLEAMSQCPDASLASSHHPLRILHRPGVLHKLLHPDRSNFMIFNVVRMLSAAVSNAPLVHECLAAKSDPVNSGKSGSDSGGRRANARFPVLELLVKHLVDRRFDLPEHEWHSLHCGILTFLTQAVLRSADMLIVLADSAALLAALIRCLSLDADFVWLQSRPTFMLPQRRPALGKEPSTMAVAELDLVQTTERIVMDTRLLNLLYNYPLPLTGEHGFAEEGREERMSPISLAAKLDQPETYSMLNGIRQSFIVALSRIAFCAEPDWIASERKMLASLLPDLKERGKEEKEVMEVVEEVEEEIEGLDRVSMLLEAIADVAGDLADIVLSPEEIDAIYELLASEEEAEAEAMDVDAEPRGVEGEGSETESEPEAESGTRKGKGLQRTTSKASTSKSMSPKKGALGAEVVPNSEDEGIDVIEIDDSD